MKDSKLRGAGRCHFYCSHYLVKTQSLPTMKCFLYFVFVSSVMAADAVRTEHDIDYLGGDRRKRRICICQRKPRRDRNFRRL